jgi:hypothetical protein
VVVVRAGFTVVADSGLVFDIGTVVLPPVASARALWNGSSSRPVFFFGDNKFKS